MVAPAPSTLKIDASTREPIGFGSFEYISHPPTHRSVYAELREVMWITFGTMHYLIDSHGTLRSTAAALRAVVTPEIGRAHV